MKAVIPAAGRGTRLYPQTHTRPKPMVRVAGKPILGHILDNFVASPIREAVIVVGAMKDIVVDYVDAHYADSLDVSYAEQEHTEGLGHAVYQAASAVRDGPVCIALGDMLFDRGYGDFLSEHRSLGDVDGSFGVKTVDEPSNYGIVTFDEDGRIARVVEKPTDPDSNLAISGIYFVEEAAALFDALETIIENDLRGVGGEFQLTDAFQRLIESGARFGTFEVQDWYDCGRPATLLEANRVLLEKQRVSDRDGGGTSVLVPPVDVGENVEVERSVVGPHVSVDDDARIVDSRIRNGIVGRGSVLTDVNLSEVIVGNDSVVAGTPTRLNVGDSSEVHL